MVLRRPSLGWAKAKLPARTKRAQKLQTASLHLRASERHSVHSSKDAIGTSRAERSDASLSFHIGRSRADEHADVPHALGLLCTRRPRPPRAECGQQFPPSDGDCHTPLPCEVRKGSCTSSCLRWSPSQKSPRIWESWSRRNGRSRCISCRGRRLVRFNFYYPPLMRTAPTIVPQTAADPIPNEV